MNHEQQSLEDDPELRSAGLHALRQELEGSIALDENLSSAGNILNVSIGGGSVVSGIDGESAVVVQIAGGLCVDAPSPVPADDQTKVFGEKEEENGKEHPLDGNRGQQGKTGHGEGIALKGRKLAKKFGRKVYTGEVINYDSERHWYKVEYEDGDQEELWWWELEPLLHQYEKRMESSSKTRSRSTRDKRLETRMLKDPDEEHLELLDELCVMSSESGTSEDDDWDGKKASPRPRRSGKKRKEGTASVESKRGASEEDSANRRALRSRISLPKETTESGGAIIGRKIRKTFNGGTWTGEIVDFEPKASAYKVVYEDGKEENLQWTELRPALISDEVGFTYEAESKHKAVENADLSKMTTPKRGEAKVDVPVVSHVKQQDPLHQAFEAARFLKNEEKNLEFYAWGEIVSFDKSKCPELKAIERLPTSDSIVHLAASHHHLVVLTAAGQVFLWRNKHGNISDRCGEWDHISDLDDKGIILVDIAGPDLDRSSAGYSSDQEDQVPDPFFLAAVSCTGKEYICQGSQPQETVHTYSLLTEFQYPSLEELFNLNDTLTENLGRIVQLAVGTVDAVDEPPFIGYITDTDRIYIRSATNDFMEEVNHVTGFSGKPVKIQCGSAYHAVIMTDDGRAWTCGGRAWTCGGRADTNDTPFSVCQPAHGSLTSKKVVDVACSGQDFLALTEDGEIHQWTHDPTLSIQNSPRKSSSIMLSSEDKLEKLALGVGVAAGISSTGKLHTWRTSFGHSVPERCATPLGRDDRSEDTCITELGGMSMIKVFCLAGSSIAVARKRPPSKHGLV